MIHIIGADHYLQPYGLKEWSDKSRLREKAMKAMFYSILREAIQSNGVRFVGEECKPNERTIPRAVAEERNCAYAEIDMPIAQRREAGIPDNYQSLGDEMRQRAYEIREQYVVARSIQSPENHKLIICGREHIAGTEGEV